MVSLIRENKKLIMERKWIDRQYIVQDNNNVAHKDVIMYCNKNKSPALPCFGPHSKTHGTRGLSKHYHLRFDPKLGNGLCEMFCIPCTCVICTPMLDKPWISGIPLGKQERYKHVTNCIYWPVLGPLNNWYNIQLAQKSTPYYAYDETHQVIFDRISDNMASLVEPGKYGAINKTDTETNGFYVIMVTLEAYKLQGKKLMDKLSLLENWLSKHNIFVLRK